MKNFALIGAAGYIAPRHLKAIKETNNKVAAALDKSDSVGILDSYFPDAAFFTEFERFDRHCEKLRRNGEKIDYVSICSPNYLHDSHIRFALRIGADAICEKPLVLNPWNIDALKVIEEETGNKINTILQLRLHPSIIELKKHVDSCPGRVFKVYLKYITSRGKWYDVSWKGDTQKSGGLVTNIGVHFFDMLHWIFGGVKENIVEEYNSTSVKGWLSLEKAEIGWFLSIDKNDLPLRWGGNTYRSLKVGNENLDEEFDFTDGFTELHTRNYELILKGKGFGIEDARPSIEIVSDIRKTSIV